MTITAVVTGAGGELGRATVRRLAADGLTVDATDVNEEALAATRDLVADCTARIVDLRDATAIESFFTEVAGEHGPVGVLVNNAAIYPARSLR